MITFFLADLCQPNTEGYGCGEEIICEWSESFYNCSTRQEEYDLYECAEDSQNGDVAGDYIPDTAPSHRYVEQKTWDDCEVDPDIVITTSPVGSSVYPPLLDPEGNIYLPDVSNFMSITPIKECRNNFTPNQVTVMKNQIGFGSNTSSFNGNGIRVTFSHQVDIINNLIGSRNQSKGTAINVFRSSEVFIYNNEVWATKLGVRALFSGTTMRENIIDVYGTGENDGGVMLSFSNGNEIADNYIYSDGFFGVESTGGFDNIIHYNDIHLNHNGTYAEAGALRMTASYDQEILSNAIKSEGGAQGLLLQNASTNTLECNEIEADIAMQVSYNSEHQNTKGNILSGNSDLVIRAELGVQIHRGNEFKVGNCYAYGLTDVEINRSLFFVNEEYPYHMPTNPNPAQGWFFDDDRTPAFCTGSSGAGPISIYENPHDLCAYYERFSYLQVTNPNKYWIKLNHILRYLINNELPVPDCIAEDVDGLCGLTELVVIYDQLIKINNIEDTEVNEAIEALQGVFIFEDENGISDELSIIKEYHKSDAIADKELLIGIKVQLGNIDCQEELVKIWRDVLLVYVALLEGEKLNETTINALESIAQLCAYDYGDAVHWARAILIDYKDENYSIYDDCGSEDFAIRPLVASDDQSPATTANVFPSPSEGNFTIALPHYWENGNIEVFDLNGQIIWQKTNVETQQLEVIFNFEEGSYFMRVTPELGESQIKKFVIIH